jgi:multiple antibiotic resistance protein
MLAALLPVINPPGLAPVFLSITKKNTPEQRSYLARRIAIYSFALLIGSLFFGGYVLSIFGIDMSVVRVSGGLLISITAWRLLNEAQHDHTSDTNETHQEMNKELLKQRAFYGGARCDFYRHYAGCQHRNHGPKQRGHVEH